MKKIFILTIGSFFALQINAQTTQSNAKLTPHKSIAAVMSADRSKMLCKPWKLDSTEEFGVIHAPNAKEKTDGVTFMADGTYFITSEGTAATGTWNGTGNPYINTSTGTPAVKMMYKIISLVDNKLVLEYQTVDLIRIQYVYSPK